MVLSKIIFYLLQDGYIYNYIYIYIYGFYEAVGLEVPAFGVTPERF